MLPVKYKALTFTGSFGSGVGVGVGVETGVGVGVGVVVSSGDEVGVSAG